MTKISVSTDGNFAEIRTGYLQNTSLASLFPFSVHSTLLVSSRSFFMPSCYVQGQNKMATVTIWSMNYQEFISLR